MKNLSRFEITMIVLAAIVALAGGGAWYYFSSELQTLHDNDLPQAEQQFVNYTQKQPYLPIPTNIKTLQGNIDLLNAHLTPLEKNKLKPDNNPLAGIQNSDTASWKNDLDTRIRKLNASAKSHNVQVPGNFYYGFSRFLTQNPGDDKTGVLDKQLAGIEALANILIQDNVKDIVYVHRSDQEDEAPSANGAGDNRVVSDKDYVTTRATSVQDGLYTAYPFETVFDTTTNNLRQVLNDLQASPYLFIVRKVEIHNSKSDSPKVSDLDHLAGTDSGDSTAPSTKGPQFLFGAETLQVKFRLDMIEWHGLPSDSSRPAPATTTGNKG